MRADPGAVQDIAGVASQVFQQRVLRGGELDRLARPRGGPAGRIHDQVGHVDRAGAHVGGAPLQSPQTREQFLLRERLDQIVVGAGVEAGDAVVHAVPRREHEDGDGAALRPERAGEVESRAVRQGDVEHDGIVGLDRHLLPRDREPGRDVHRVRGLPQALGDRVGQPRLVFHQQNAHDAPSYAANFDARPGQRQCSMAFIMRS